MKRLLWLRLVLCVLLVPQLALGAQLPLVVEWMATAPLQLTWTQSTASEAHPEPLPIFPHAPAVQSTRTRQGALSLCLTCGEPVQLAQAEPNALEVSKPTWTQSTASEASLERLPIFPHAPAVQSTRTRKGEAQLAQARLDEDGLPDDSQLFAEQAGGWGLPQRDDFQRMQNQPGQYMQQLRYEYDLVGNIVALRNDAPYSNTANASVLIATTSQSFEYDKLYQIKSASGVMQDRNDWRYTYSFAQEYDAVGNIVLKDQSAWRQVPDNGSWRNDNQNRDISYASTYSYGGSQAHAPNVIAEQLPNESSAYSRVLTYDASGNQVQNAFRGHTRSIVWNEDDQVKQVIRDGQELNRTLYDAQGQKAVHLHRVSGNEETAYLGPNLTIRDGKYITKHVFAGSERVSSKMDPAWFQYPPTMYYHSDHLGSAQYVTIDNQEMVQHAEYLPSGELWQNASDSRFELARRFLFTGKELDIHTGLYDFGARQYDARQGQWLSPDPILAQYIPAPGEESGDLPGAGGVFAPANLNAFGYAWNQPTRLVDPTGEAIETAWDVLNVLVSAQSLGENLDAGRYWAAAVDLVGLSYDLAASATPGLPAGAGAIRNAPKLVEKGRALSAKLGTHIEKAPGFAKNALKSVKNKLDESLDVVSKQLAGGEKVGSRFGPNTVGSAQRVLGKVVQTGGNKIKKSTANALNKATGSNLSPRQWGRGLEALKEEFSLHNNYHGKITEYGYYLDKGGREIGNIIDYL